MVVVNDSATPHLTTGMTFEARVRPSTAMTGWKAILQKQTDAYFLNANTDTNHVGVGAGRSEEYAARSSKVQRRYQQTSGRTWRGRTTGRRCGCI
mgnify:CR=1 FL=1